MNNTTCASDVRATCDYMLNTTGIPDAVWLLFAILAIIIGSIGLVASQRMIAEEQRRKAEFERQRNAPQSL